MPADKELQRELRVLHLGLQAAYRECDTRPGLNPPPVTHFSNKATPTPTRPYLLIVSFSMSIWGPFFFKLPQMGLSGVIPQ